jgi:hypothetical protein
LARCVQRGRKVRSGQSGAPPVSADFAMCSRRSLGWSPNDSGRCDLFGPSHRLGVRTDERTNGRADERTSGRADARTHGRTDARTHVRTAHERGHPSHTNAHERGNS